MSESDDGGAEEVTAQSLEDVRDKLAAYIMRPNMAGETILDLAPGFSLIYGVADLAAELGLSAAMVGKIRRNYKQALAQALEPGREPRCEVLESRLYGRVAITVRKK